MTKIFYLITIPLLFIMSSKNMNSINEIKRETTNINQFNVANDFYFLRVRWSDKAKDQQKEQVRHLLESQYGKSPFERHNPDGSMVWRFNLGAMSSSVVSPNASRQVKNNVIHLKIEDLEETIPD